MLSTLPRRLLLVMILLTGAGVLSALLPWPWQKPPGHLRPVDPSAPIDPRKTYHLTLWETAWPALPGSVPYGAWLARRLADFRQAHPNVEVDVTWLPPGEMATRLQGATLAGASPDVAGAGPEALALYDPLLQVPASLYMAPDERAAYPRSVLAGVREARDSQAGQEAGGREGRGGTLWAWPRWLALRTWLVAPATPAESSGRAGARNRALLVADPPYRVLADLMAAAGQPALLSAGGQPLWDREVLSRNLAWLAAMKKQGRLAGRVHDPLGFESLLSGRAGAVAGASPWAAANLLARARQGRLAWQGTPALAMPPAVLGKAPLVPAEVGAYLVFRQRPYRGDDRTRAAAELARHLSRAGLPWSHPEGPLVAAAPRPEPPTYAGFAARAVPLAAPAPVRPWAVLREEDRLLREVVSPAVAELLAGRQASNRVADAILRALPAAAPALQGSPSPAATPDPAPSKPARRLGDDCPSLAEAGDAGATEGARPRRLPDQAYGPTPPADFLRQAGTPTLLATFHSPLDHATPSQVRNVELALRRLRGHTLQPDEEYSFNRAIGPFTARQGFGLGDMIIGTRIFQAEGGGVCQVSSTLHNTILLAGLKVLERHAHTLAVPYMPPGQDAAVTVEGAKDYRFRNTRPTPVLLWGHQGDGRLTISLYGAGEAPRRRLEHKVMATWPPPELAVPDPSLKPGEQVVVDPGLPGRRIRYWITEVSPRGVERAEIETDLQGARPRVIRVGPPAAP